MSRAAVFLIRPPQCQDKKRELLPNRSTNRSFLFNNLVSFRKLCTGTNRRCRSAPDFFRGLGYQAQLRLLVLDTDEVPFHGRGEPTLRAQRQPVQRNKRRGLGDPLLQFFLALERGFLRTNQS